MKSNVELLFDVLACPECKDDSQLRVRDASEQNMALWRQLLNEEPDTSREITCLNCERSYPTTHDGIPVLWSDVLKETFSELDTAIQHAAPSERDVKSANIHTYEATVDQYHEAGIHADTVTLSRFQDALRLVKQELAGWHLDVGCGGGNVLRMTNGTALNPRVGMDVTISALRLVMKQGFLVVLGDAERLPFKSGSMTLVTASSVLHHLYDPTRLIAEAYSVLRPGGVFFTDFDPNKLAADWSWLMLAMYRARLPVYRVLSRCVRRRVGHRDANIQDWNSVAEFHNRPGAGFSPARLAQDIAQAGFKVLLIFPHNTTDGNVIVSTLVKPTPRHFVAQLFSGRNPFFRRNADTLLTLSTKQ